MSNEHWNIGLLKETHEEVIEVVEVLGRSSNGTTTIRDAKGRVHIAGGKYKLGDIFTLTIEHRVFVYVDNSDMF